MNNFFNVLILIFSVIAVCGVFYFIYQQKIFGKKIDKSLVLVSKILKVEEIRQKIEKMNQNTIELTEEVKLSNVFFSNTNEAILIADSDKKILAVNPAFVKITGYRQEEILNKDMFFLSIDKYTDDFFENIFNKVEKEGFVTERIWNRNKNNELFMEQIKINPVYNNDNKIINYVCMFTDVSKDNQERSELMKMATIDQLTELPNRVSFNDRLERCLSSSERNNTTGALFFIDLDHFKSINDTLGHHVGDLLLKEVAERLRLSVRANDTVARLAGDEFTVILPVINKSEDAAVVAQNIVTKLIEKPYFLDGNEVQMSCSVGVAIFPDDANYQEGIINAADQAMYQAKQAGKNRFKFYSSQLDANLSRKKMLEKNIKEALDKNEFFLRCMPIYDFANKIHILEVGLGWKHEGEEIPPFEFIPLIEESGFINDVTSWLIKEILKINSGLLHKQKYSIKLSSIQFKQRNVVELLLNKIGVENAQYFMFRIDESIISKNITEASEKLKSFMNYNFSICIDDFGTGKISFVDLVELPFDYVKIPKELTKEIANEKYYLTIKSLMELASNFKVKTIIEGIEDNLQIDKVQQINVSEKVYIQGYLLSESFDSDKLKNILK